MSLLPPPLSLYVHLPWCVRKCPYCDFNSHPAPASLPQADYVDALLQDLEHDLPHVAGRPLHSIFFGSLKTVNPAIKNWIKVGDIITMQATILKSCATSMEQFRGSGSFTQSGLN